MSDSSEGPQQPGPRDPWAPPEQPVQPAGPRPVTPPVAEQPTVTSLRYPAAGQPPASPVPPPPIAPTGPGAPGYGPYGGASPYGAGGPYDTTGYGTAYGSGSPYAVGPSGYPGAGYGHAPHPAGYGAANGLGITGLVLGIIGTVCTASIVAFFLGILLGVLAIVFGAIGRAKASRGEAANGGQALAGLVLGLIALVGGIAILIGLIVDISNDPEPVGGPDTESYSASSVPYGYATTR
ncbi:DUF4190 domain-containing protein [Streptomyces sp. 8N706]|uniref:DUF4190 domain-containing protein n=1 Tax=Streptomyces sp. 8N706 TaxID=3457416 RepID=UPI003FD604CD